MHDLLSRIRPTNRHRPLNRHRPRAVGASMPPRPVHGFVDEVLAGIGRAVWIEGGPGSGKTDLLTQILADADTRGCRLAGAPTNVGTGADRLLARFRHLSAEAPLVVAVDDLHLADPATIEFWGRLAVETRRLPLLLLATARPDPDQALLTRVRDDLRSAPIRVACCRVGPAELSPA